MNAAVTASPTRWRGIQCLSAAARFPFHPIIIRDVRVQLRSGRALRILLLEILILSVVLVMLHLTQIEPEVPYSAHASPPNPSSVYETGQIFRSTVYGANLFVALILGATLPLAAIARERSQRALEYLRLTPLHPLGIVLAEVTATLIIVAATMLFSLPLLLIAGLYGDIMLLSSLKIGWYCLLTALLIGSLGCLFGAGVKRPMRSQGLLIAFLLFLIYISGALFATVPSGNVGYFLPAFAAIQEMTQTLPPPVPIAGVALPQWLLSTAFTCFLSAFLLLGAGRKLYQPDAPVLTPAQFFIGCSICLGLVHGLSWHSHHDEWRVMFGIAAMAAVLMSFTLALPSRRVDPWPRKQAWSVAAILIVGSAALLIWHLEAPNMDTLHYATFLCIPFFAYAALADQIIALGRALFATRRQAITFAMVILVGSGVLVPLLTAMSLVPNHAHDSRERERQILQLACGMTPMPVVMTEYFVKGIAGAERDNVFKDLSQANVGQMAALALAAHLVRRWLNKRSASARHRATPAPME